MNNKQNNVVQTFLSAGKKLWCRHPACNYFVSSWQSVQSVDNPVDRCGCRRRAAAFTLIEMLVALSILIILMAAVGEIFSIAGRTVRLGQATLAAMSSVRAVEAQIAHDIKHLDQNGFLIIRQRYYAPYWQTGVQYEPGDEVEYINSSGTFGFYLCQQANVTQTGYSVTSPPPSVPGTGGASITIWQPIWIPNTAYVAGESTYPIWRSDQLCFMETGDFHSRSGSGAGASATMASYLTANKAMVWFGQFSASYGAAGTADPTAGSPPAIGTTWAEKPYWPQNQWIPLGTPPSGQTSGQFYFGREAMLLIPQGGNTFISDLYTDPFYDSGSNANANPGVSYAAPTSSGATETPATATSSRLDAAYDAIPSTSTSYTLPIYGLVSPSGVGTIEGYVNSLPLASPYTSLYDIADFFCYRYSTLPTAGASEIGTSGSPQQALNGYYRMTPIMLQGVPSFAVDWTDGVQGIPTGQTVNQLEWYGLDGNTEPSPPPNFITNSDGPRFPASISTSTIPNPIAVSGNSPAIGLGPVTYVFYAGNRPYWPKALKITYCVTDPNNRLQGGRWITQVVNLPQ